MFAKATRNFLKEVDAGGNLIAVTNLNDPDKLQLLSLVTKKRDSGAGRDPSTSFYLSPLEMYSQKTNF